MIRNLITLLLVGALGSCLLAAPPRNDSPLQDTVDAMSALKANLEIPDHFMTENPQRTGEEFDPNLYFTILDHLSMEPGYILDYVYVYDFLGGYPVLYARPQNQSPYRTYEELIVSPQASDSYLDHVQADGTEESYFQYVVLDIMGRQFYLFWHANYNDTRIVCDSEALEVILGSLGSFGGEMPAADKARARKIDLEPVIEIGTDTVTVQITTFTHWGGFYRERYTLQRQFPHTVIDFEADELVPYECGIMF